MQVLTEAALRNALPQGRRRIELKPGDVVTASAARYAKEQGIELVAYTAEVMSRAPIDFDSALPFVDALTGERYADKPEHMTHLHGNALVAKSHPRIAFRGHVDRLEAEVILLQVICSAEAEYELVEKLHDLLQALRSIMAADVKEESLVPLQLWGFDAEALRRSSHDVAHSVGIEHPVPDYRMGEIPARLNLLRTLVRMAELSAIEAFGEAQSDIVTAMNRLSSAVYLLFVREVMKRG